MVSEIEIKVGSNMFFPKAIAWVNAYDPVSSIHLGCRVEVVNELLVMKPKELTSVFWDCVDVNQVYEKHIESILVHETIHLILNNIIGWEKDTFDNIDNLNEISGAN